MRTVGQFHTTRFEILVDNNRVQCELVVLEVKE